VLMLPITVNGFWTREWFFKTFYDSISEHV